MTGAVVASLHLRLSRVDQLRLARAFLASAAIHLLILGFYLLAERLHWRPDVLVPGWLKQTRKIEQVILAKQQAMANPEQPPLVFVHVSPAQATPEPPKNTKFYSDKNSLAANPEADQDTGVPKITGSQEHVPKTEDTPRQPFDRLQPAAPAAAAPPQEETRARPAAPPGDLTLAKPDFNRPSDTGTAERSRPRTLAEARARQQPAPPGPKMRQEGGVKRRLEFAALDARATPFGAYDAAFVQAVSERWFALLDAKHYDGYQRGRVVLQFALHPDGRVTDMKVVESSVGLDLSLLCEMAVLDPAPYAPWPSDLRRLVEGDRRKVQFTFYYN